MKITPEWIWLWICMQQDPKGGTGMLAEYLASSGLCPLPSFTVGVRFGLMYYDRKGTPAGEGVRGFDQGKARIARVPQRRLGMRTGGI